MGIKLIKRLCYMGSLEDSWAVMLAIVWILSTLCGCHIIVDCHRQAPPIYITFLCWTTYSRVHLAVSSFIFVVYAGEKSFQMKPQPSEESICTEFSSPKSSLPLKKTIRTRELASEQKTVCINK